MKNLIYKTALFVVPFLILYLITLNYASPDRGDLSKLGYLTNSDYDFRILFKKEYQQPNNVNYISEINLDTINNFDFLVVGDSFSDQGCIAYQNYLTNLSGDKILYYDRFLHNNPLETVHGLLNGDLFNKIKLKYTIIQSVERKFAERGKNVNKKVSILIKSIKEKIRKSKIIEIKQTEEKEFFTKAIFRFPLYNLNYNFDDNAFFSPVYKVETKTKLFTNINKELLFTEIDLIALKDNNSKVAVNTLNNELNDIANRLKTKEISLIVLPCPDKFDFYYDHILEKKKYTRPLFFNFLQDLPKDYLYVNSKKCLTEKSKNHKDLYFYDDTHWSPKSAKFIASEINALIKK